MSRYDGTVYVMRSDMLLPECVLERFDGEHVEIVKIGFTSGNVRSRLKSIQTGHPCMLQVWFSFRGGMDVEARIHERADRFRLYGEWFALPPHWMDRLRRAALVGHVRTPEHFDAIADYLIDVGDEPWPEALR